MPRSDMTVAQQQRKDEFYTQLADIEKELRHYRDQFCGKVVLCNCDDPYISNFFHYFAYNFEALKLKKLITTCYKNQQWNLFSFQNDKKPERAVYIEYTGDKDGDRVPSPQEIGVKPLKGDGDFRSAECIELLKQADIVVTNPPFSLFREYLDQLIRFDKKFLIIGNTSSFTYKEVFTLFNEDRIRTGYTNFNVGMFFIVPDNWEKFHHIDDAGRKIARVSASCWLTNLEVEKHKEILTFHRNYDPENYPTYDNYDAINVDKYTDIPRDYTGVIGVPVTFLNKYNPEQFEIIKFRKGNDDKDLTINGRYPFFRILVRNKLVKMKNEN